jgi:ABC-2 type transport system permease protein
MEQGQTDYYRSIQASVLEEKIRVGHFIVDHKIATNDDIRVEEAEIIYNNIGSKRELFAEVDFGKEAFNATEYKDYAQYKEMVTIYNNNIDNEIAMSWYAIEHNFPHASSKFLNTIDNSYGIFIFITLLMIIRASSTLVSEYHSGTIKLLLTRGSSRLKIITSKIINIILSSYILSLLFIIIFIIVGSFFFDINDLLAPKLAVIGGTVVEKSYIIWLLKNILIITLPMIFLGSFSFLLASITLNGIIASGTTIFLSLVGLNMMSFITGSYMFFLKYTPFAYLNMTGFASHHMGISDAPLTPSIFSFNSGISILLISTLICYGIGIIIFKTRDIKN